MFVSNTIILIHSSGPFSSIFSGEEWPYGDACDHGLRGSRIFIWNACCSADPFLLRRSYQLDSFLSSFSSCSLSTYSFSFLHFTLYHLEAFFSLSVFFLFTSPNSATPYLFLSPSFIYISAISLPYFITPSRQPSLFSSFYCPVLN